MASFTAIYSVGNSIAQYLQNAYPPALAANFPCQFKLVSSIQIATEDQHALDQMLSIGRILVRLLCRKSGKREIRRQSKNLGRAVPGVLDLVG